MITVGQGPISLAVGGGDLDILTLIYIFSSFSLSGLNSILLINRHIQQDKDIYGTGSDRKLTAYINHLLFGRRCDID